MGFSMSWAASKKIDKLSQFCVDQTGSQNTWKAGDHTYFFEVTRRDQPDMGVRASVHKFVGKNLASKVGSIAIHGDGRVLRAPALVRRVLNA